MNTATKETISRLAAIEAAHAEVGKMIEAFKAAAPTTYGLPAALIELAPGERYAGLLLDDEGEPSHHLILLPGELDEVTWADAIEWAKSNGGELPTRREQSLLFANLKGQFQSAWYWSSEQSSDTYAWVQYFGNGSQSNTCKKSELRARAVRRLSV